MVIITIITFTTATVTKRVNTSFLLVVVCFVPILIFLKRKRSSEVEQSGYVHKFVRLCSKAVPEVGCVGLGWSLSTWLA